MTCIVCDRNFVNFDICGVVILNSLSIMNYRDGPTHYNAYSHTQPTRMHTHIPTHAHTYTPIAHPPSLSRCQDYLQIIRGSFGTTDSCGSVPSDDAVVQLEFADYTAVFRTSEQVRGEGFEMYSICFRPVERNLEGMGVVVCVCVCLSVCLFIFLYPYVYVRVSMC